MRRILLSVFMLTLVITALATLPTTPTPTNAQGEDQVNARVDQALNHLTGWVGSPVALTRQGSLRYTWSLNPYGDASLGCPAEGVAYAQGQVLAYRIQITLDNGNGATFDYRLTQSGDVLVLCGADGLPLFRTDTPLEQPVTTAVPTSAPVINPPVQQTTPIPQSTWLAVVYTQAQDSLTFINSGGEVARINRPRTGDESFTLGAQSPNGMQLSPGGRYFAQLVPNVAGGNTLAITDLSTGVTVYQDQSTGSDTFYLSFAAFNDRSYSPNFNAAGTRFTYTVFDGNYQNGWSLVTVNLAAPNEAPTILRDEDLSTLLNTLNLGNDPLATGVADNPAFFIPSPVFHDALDQIHFQMVPAGTEAAGPYAAFAWGFTTPPSLSFSPYTPNPISIQGTTGVAVYPDLDPVIGVMVPTVPSGPRGPDRNSVILGVPVGTALNETVLFASSTYQFESPLWASADGSTVAFELVDSEFNLTLGIFNESIASAQGGAPTLIPYGVGFVQLAGIANGLLLLDSDNGDLAQYDAVGNRGTVWTAPPQQGQTRLVWALPADGQQRLFSLTSQSGGTPAVQQGTQYCAGTIISQITVGDAARVTFTDGTPLRLRAAAGTGGTFLQDMPEGTTFSIVGGPVCANGFTWWNVRLGDDTIGWAAEGDLDTYFMEPLN